MSRSSTRKIVISFLFTTILIVVGSRMYLSNKHDRIDRLIIDKYKTEIQNEYTMMFSKMEFIKKKISWSQSDSKDLVINSVISGSSLSYFWRILGVPPMISKDPDDTVLYMTKNKLLNQKYSTTVLTTFKRPLSKKIIHSFNFKLANDLKRDGDNIPTANKIILGANKIGMTRTKKIETPDSKIFQLSVAYYMKEYNLYVLCGTVKKFSFEDMYSDTMNMQTLIVYNMIIHLIILLFFILDDKESSDKHMVDKILNYDELSPKEQIYIIAHNGAKKYGRMFKDLTKNITVLYDTLGLLLVHSDANLIKVNDFSSILYNADGTLVLKHYKEQSDILVKDLSGLKDTVPIDDIQILINRINSWFTDTITSGSSVMKETKLLQEYVETTNNAINNVVSILKQMGYVGEFVKIVTISTVMHIVLETDLSYTDSIDTLFKAQYDILDDSTEVDKVKDLLAGIINTLKILSDGIGDINKTVSSYVRTCEEVDSELSTIYEWVDIIKNNVITVNSKECGNNNVTIMTKMTHDLTKSESRLAELQELLVSISTVSRFVFEDVENMNKNVKRLYEVLNVTMTNE